MFYLLAILFPPLAVIFKGSPTDFFFNIILSMLGYLPGIIHAFMVVNKANK